jgi:NAD(P)-dependent dehydrogenase (short-subunit alcohol dehydrogenase family)
MTSSQRTALVTGANKGIGFETARQLAQEGFTVWLGARDQGRGEAAEKELADDGDVRFVRLDVTDEDSIRAAAERVGDETGALDVLVNNAAVAFEDEEGHPSAVRVDTVQRTFDANFLGAMRVTQAFLPLVRQARAGRIVNVSSTMGSLTTKVSAEHLLEQFPPVFAYSASKTALNSLTAWLAVELRDTPIKVNSVCPGYNATDMNNHRGTQHPSVGAKVVVGAATLPADGPSGSFLDVDGTVGW